MPACIIFFFLFFSVGFFSFFFSFQIIVMKTLKRKEKNKKIKKTTKDYYGMKSIMFLKIRVPVVHISIVQVIASVSLYLKCCLYLYVFCTRISTANICFIFISYPNGIILYVTRLPGFQTLNCSCTAESVLIENIVTN